MSGTTCECGCKQPARWLCTGESPEGGFSALPCCDTSTRYLSDCCAEFGLPFSKSEIKLRRVLITGSRNWTDEAPIRELIDSLPSDAIVIHGNAPGADLIANRLSLARGLHVKAWQAAWHRFGRDAGPMRNQRMVDEGKPTEAHAFPLPGSRGTWDCVRRCEAAGVPVTVHLASGGDEGR